MYSNYFIVFTGATTIADGPREYYRSVPQKKVRSSQLKYLLK